MRAEINNTPILSGVVGFLLLYFLNEACKELLSFTFLFICIFSCASPLVRTWIDCVRIYSYRMDLNRILLAFYVICYKHLSKVLLSPLSFSRFRTENSWWKCFECQEAICYVLEYIIQWKQTQIFRVIFEINIWAYGNGIRWGFFPYVPIVVIFFYWAMIFVSVLFLVCKRMNEFDVIIYGRMQKFRRFNWFIIMICAIHRNSNMDITITASNCMLFPEFTAFEMCCLVCHWHLTFSQLCWSSNQPMSVRWKFPVVHFVVCVFPFFFCEIHQTHWF